MSKASDKQASVQTDWSGNVVEKKRMPDRDYTKRIKKLDSLKTYSGLAYFLIIVGTFVFFYGMYNSFESLEMAKKYDGESAIYLVMFTYLLAYLHYVFILLFLIKIVDFISKNN